MKAHEILQAGVQHMQDRASTYDKPEGERSMPATVAAFNAITGHELTAEQGWIFMALLKAVRSQQGEYREDSYQDGAAYFALAGEQAAEDRQARPLFNSAGGPMVVARGSDWCETCGTDVYTRLSGSKDYVFRCTKCKSGMLPR